MLARPVLSCLLPLALLLTACGSTEDRRLRYAASELMEEPLNGLNAQERAEAAWLMALADPGAVLRARAAATPLNEAQDEYQALGTVTAGARYGAERASQLFEALYDFDARSYFSEVSPRRPLYLTEGAAFRAALDSLGRDDTRARVQAAEQALAAARRWQGMAPGIAQRARSSALIPRASLLAAMASAADADARAIRQSEYGAGAYGGHDLRRLREIADDVSRISAALWSHHAPLADAAAQSRANREAAERAAREAERAAREAERRRQRSGGAPSPVRASG